MTEYEIFALTNLNSIQIAINGLGMIFLTWVGFRVANKAAEAGTFFVKIIALLFNVCVWVGLLANSVWNTFNTDNAAYLLSQAQSNGAELSDAAVGLIAWRGGELATFSWAPNVFMSFFLVAVVCIVIYTLFVKKES